MKFRSKETVSAVQFTGRGDKPAVLDLLNSVGIIALSKCVMTRSGNIVIPAHSSGDVFVQESQIAHPNDWIVGHPAGWAEVVPDEEFLERYELSTHDVIPEHRLAKAEVPADDDLAIPQFLGALHPLDHPLGYGDPPPANWSVVVLLIAIGVSLAGVMVWEVLKYGVTLSWG